MERNLEKIAGNQAEKIKEFLVEPIKRNETARVELANGLRHRFSHLSHFSH